KARRRGHALAPVQTPLAVRRPLCDSSPSHLNLQRPTSAPPTWAAPLSSSRTENMLDHSCQVQRHPLVERGLDLYETPAVATKTLLRVEKIPTTVWEPAAGRGAITRVLADADHKVISSDIYDYGFPLHFVGDFLKQKRMPAGCDCIL